MKHDLKIGISIGTVLATCIVLIISLWPGQSMEQRHRENFRQQQIDLPITTRRETPLKEPAKTPPAVNIHTVKSGETLSSISMQYYGTAGYMQVILDANKSKLRDKDQIRPGMRLIIPTMD